MEYRKATADDSAELAVLRKAQLIDEGSTADTDIDKELIRYFCEGLSNDTLAVWLATEDGDIIATAGVCFFSYPPTFRNPTGKTAYITAVYTKDRYRRKGIATKLLSLVMDEIQDRGYTQARLHSSAQAKHMYECLGFGDAEGFMSKTIGR